jgi:regulator of RNase E activity RraA
MSKVSQSQFEFLRSIDTPTVCNLIEIVAPERRGTGYTVKHLHCPYPDLPPVVAFAKTVTIRSRDAVPLGQASYMDKRLDYLDYVAAEPRPSVVVIQDLDDPPGYGAFWGEVQSNVHKSLGCLGTITNGSVRDIPMNAPGFQMLAGSLSPSHAYVHVVEFGLDVSVHGMDVRKRRPDPRRPARRRHGAGRQDRCHEGGTRRPRQARSAHHRDRARTGRHRGGDQGGDPRVSLRRSRLHDAREISGTVDNA